MVEDLERFKVSPQTGSEMGNQAVVDSNLEVTNRFCLPSSETNTLNGGKSKDGVAKLTNGILNILFNGVWTEYLTSVDGLKEVGGITLEDSTVTIVSPVKWRINSVNYSKLSNTIFNINPTTLGSKRIDLIYANTSNNLLLIQGVETTGVAVEPSLPPNTVKVAPVFVSDDEIQQPFPDLSGFLTKEMADTLYSVISPSGSYIQANPLQVQDASIKIKQGLNAADDRFVVQTNGYVSVANSNKTGLVFDISEGNGIGIYNTRLKLQSDEVKFVTLTPVGGGLSIASDEDDLLEISEDGDVTMFGMLTSPKGQITTPPSDPNDIVRLTDLNSAIQSGQTIGASTTGNAATATNSTQWNGNSISNSTPTTGQFIVYNGTNYIPKTITGTSPINFNNATSDISLNITATKTSLAINLQDVTGVNGTTTNLSNFNGGIRASTNDGNANTLVRNTDLGTGWGVYNDTTYTVGSPFTINSGVTSTLPNNAGTVLNTQLPIGVISFYDPGTSKITPQNDGDYYVVTIRFKAKTTAPTAGFLDFAIDIGGALGQQFKETKIFAKGAGIEHQFALVVPMYSASTFIANGGLVKLTAGSGNMTVYDISYHIDRTHKAR